MEIERFLYLAGALVTHAFVGYSLVKGLTDTDPRIGIVFGLLPDGDFYFPAVWEWPFIHRGLTHTPLFALATLVAAYAVCRDRTVTLAVGVAIGSHLAIDSLSPKGISWLFPLETTWTPGIGVHGLASTVVLWTVSIGILAFNSGGVPSVPYRTPRNE